MDPKQVGYRVGQIHPTVMKEKAKMRLSKIYLDMDGVLSDFDREYKEFNGISCEEVWRDRDRKQFSELWQRFVEARRFEWLPKFSGHDELLEYVRSLGVPVEILSSSGTGEWHDTVREQKTAWLRRHHIEFPVNVVPGKRLKGDFATPTSLLIDDTEKCIDIFRERGGLAILHQNVVDTVRELELIISDCN